MQTSSPSREAPAAPIVIWHDEVAGMPAFWAEAPGPFTAAVLFRVGRVDETLATSGVTHIVEHLAIRHDDAEQVHSNAQVDPTTTMFWASGTRDEVIAFLTRVMTDLSHLPLARLSSEKQVLLVEGSTRGGGIVGDLAAARFGPNGLGLLGYRELGVHRLVEADVESWARERFTTHNAVMWFSGPPPDGFRTELEPGMHIPAPEPTGLPIMSMPAWTYGPQGGVAVSYLGARTSGLAAMAQIATRRANTRLRHERSLSYSVQNVYLPLTSEVAYVTIVADCTEATSARVRDGMLEILFDLAEHGPRVEELQQLAAERRRMTEHPQWAYAELQRLANDAVLGRELESGEGQIAELEAVSPHEARPAFEEALKGLVVMAPSGLDMSSMPFGPIDVLAQPRVSGKSIRLPKDARNLLKARRIELSREGVSLVGDGGDAVTLRFATLSAVLQWPGGRRLLLNYDGTSVDFCPDHFRGGADLIRLIDESVDPTVVVPMDSPPPPH